MSNIPSAALSSALTPITRQANAAAQARKLQIQKNFHHAEDVEELNDSGVDSINDHPQEKNKGDQPEQEGKGAFEEKVEIASLKKAEKAAGAIGPVRLETRRLDVSA